jgi:hypothetical protein
MRVGGEENHCGLMRINSQILLIGPLLNELEVVVECIGEQKDIGWWFPNEEVISERRGLGKRMREVRGEEVEERGREDRSLRYAGLS